MSSENPGRPRPFAGVRVLDCSQVLAGPYAGRLLAEMGADVIKLEAPAGDATRVIAPKGDRGMSGMYTWANLGKRNVCIDLRRPEGRELGFRLACWADVILENFRPGVAERLGLGWEAVHAANPRGVMVSISGFGSDSSLRDRGAYAPTMHAATGLLEYTARKAKLPVRPLADAYADLTTAMHAMVGLCAALRVAERTGVGERVEIAMYDAVLGTYSETCFELFDPSETRPEPPAYDAGDNGRIAVAGPPQHVWSELRKHFPEEIADPARPGMELPEKASLRHATIERWMCAQASREALLHRLELEANLPCAPVATLHEALTGPFAQERGLLLEVDDRLGGTRPVVRLPYRFSRSAVGAERPAPFRGEHNTEVARELLGLDDARIRELEAAGVLLVGSPQDRPERPGVQTS